MKAMKSATASTKEAVQNAAAKWDEQVELNKASATAKAERKNAENKAGKHDTKANYHNKQAEILREYELKKEQNAAEKDQKKAAMYQSKADKHAGQTGAAGLSGENQSASTGPVAEPYNPPQTGPTDQTVNDQFTASTPILSDAQNTSSAPAREGDEIDSRPTPADIPQNVKDVPLHGSGVPVHSSLHSDQAGDAFDKSTTHTMGATPHTGSYM